MCWRSCRMSSSRRGRSSRGAGLRRPWRRVAGVDRRRLARADVAASAWIHPHYLAYFNWASGGPDRVPPRLIDSNLDWGQDLVELQRWWKENIPTSRSAWPTSGRSTRRSSRCGESRSAGFCRRAARDGAADAEGDEPPADRTGPQAEPGYYAVSATLLYGLPWRLYDPAPLAPSRGRRSRLELPRTGRPQLLPAVPPDRPIGHSIYIYRLSEEDAARLNAGSEGRPAADARTPDHPGFRQT